MNFHKKFSRESLLGISASYSSFYEMNVMTIVALPSLHYISQRKVIHTFSLSLFLNNGVAVRASPIASSNLPDPGQRTQARLVGCRDSRSKAERHNHSTSYEVYRRVFRRSSGPRRFFLEVSRLARKRSVQTTRPETSRYGEASARHGGSREWQSSAPDRGVLHQPVQARSSFCFHELVLSVIPQSS